MHWLQKHLVPLWGELLIILLFILVSSKFLGDRNDLIQADGRGYYEFLPATFIYNDLQLNYLDTLQTEFYDNRLMAEDFYGRLENGKRFDKYFAGTAVLQVPFFLVGHLYTSFSDHAADGFSRPYQISVYIAALFYAFFGLVFMRLLLVSYAVNRFWILAAQTGVIFCSSMLHYMHWDAAYSHVYSFFLVSGFLYFARKFLQANGGKTLFWTILFLGLIFLVRPVNVIIVLFIPMLSENKKQLVESLKSLFSVHVRTFAISIITIVLIYQVQCAVWYFQTGHWFYYSYGKETFVWSDPMIFDFLFSYRKGFFIWAPWFFILVLLGIVFHSVRKMWFRLISFGIAFSLLIYVLSSWWFWSYGGSIGSRPMIDFYPALIAFAAPIYAGKPILLKWIAVLLIPACAFVMVTQVYQYQRGILTYDSMDKASYWKVFLKTEEMYENYLWKREIPLKKQVSENAWVKHVQVDADRWYVSDTLLVTIPAGIEVKKGQITFVSQQKSNAESLEIRLLDVNDSLLYNHYNRMLHAVDEQMGNQFIDYRFEVPVNLPQKVKTVFVMNTKTSAVVIDSMKIRFFAE